MKTTLTMTELRSEPGELIREVARHGRTFIITKAGKPVAMLVPFSAGPFVRIEGSTAIEAAKLVERSRNGRRRP
jgi:prevent-host-death family protein